MNFRQNNEQLKKKMQQEICFGQNVNINHVFLKFKSYK